MTKINSVCNKLKMLGKVRILAGVSGGADSIALLLLLLRAGMDIQVIHFEHGIRGADSVADADFVLNFCRERRSLLPGNSARCSGSYAAWGKSGSGGPPDAAGRVA